MTKHAPIIAGCDYFLHGGDYNPDQWLDRPEIIDADFRLMRLARCNTFSVGIFAWSVCEPEEGRFEFGWLDRIMDRMAEAGNKVFLATPSGARPPWLSAKYPEVRRVDRHGIRDTYRERQNHCWRSPVYREKVREINRRLAERYAGHPALAAWHISNEYNGDCYCELCKKAFREYLERKFGTLENFNRRCWTSFWSHRYGDWSEIEPDDPCMDAVALEWRRFATEQVCDFMRWEIDAVRQHSQHPVTTNMMGFFQGINYYRIAELCDFIADDRYPGWCDARDFASAASESAMIHDLHRTMAKKPFVLLESTPSNLNWKPFYRLKRPGLHRAEELLAVGHGADAVMYFQFRKGRGGSEKLHGAVVDHEGSENTRVFRDVAEVGEILEKIGEVRGTMTHPEVAVIYDWDSHDALLVSQGPSATEVKKPCETILQHYRAFWELNIPVDVVESTADLSAYKLVAAPMLYMLKPGVAENLRKFVAGGGVLISGYLSGYVNEDNLVFEGGLPGDGLRELFGIRQEELDGLTPDDRQFFRVTAANSLNLTGSHAVRDYAERIHPEGAEVLAEYVRDFYAGEAALTVNAYGQGFAYYQAGRSDLDFLLTFYGKLAKRHGIRRLLTTPAGVHATVREGEGKRYLFVYNFARGSEMFHTALRGRSLIDGSELTKEVVLPRFGSQVYRLEDEDVPERN